MKFEDFKKVSTLKNVFIMIGVIVLFFLVYYFAQATYWERRIARMEEPYKSIADSYCYVSFGSCGGNRDAHKFPSFSCMRKVSALMEKQTPLPPNCPSGQEAFYPMCKGGLPYCGPSWKERTQK